MAKACPSLFPITATNTNNAPWRGRGLSQLSPPRPQLTVKWNQRRAGSWRFELKQWLWRARRSLQLLILLLTQLRPIFRRLTPLTVGRPSHISHYSGKCPNPMESFSHLTLPPSSLTTLVCFKLTKNWPARTPFSQSHTLLGWYTTRTAC